ncbi:hypothetical protein NE619_09465 [Anaerovorax odorimutans]|uniref:Uncharacterized protein n=1 Tax=Anaerovorax odorimutans TaxID=109327 RepID=A0ABT1RP40_9FIRM|nr:hypothetical protein [Anaerovorax odorimutans]MCQ4636959.1 hypothetical protein [Anaerovorax odorimutans]
MVKNSASSDFINMNLRQLGAASIQAIGSKMHLVTFEISDTVKVSYIYNVTRKDKFFLQRTEPYAIAKGKFADENEIVEFIQKDIESFRNAAGSRNFEKFSAIGKKLSNMIQNVEEMFLTCNVDGELLEDVSSRLDSIDLELKQIIQLSQKL